MLWLWILLAVVAVLVIYIIATYNGLIKLKVRVEEAWSDITVQLKRRADLIPNLVNTVQGYAKHEKSVFEEVTKARSAIMDAQGDVQKSAEAENMLTGALKSLFAVAEAYPDLKANQNFIELQAQLEGTENRITVARNKYIQSVQQYNVLARQFPTNLTAMVMGYKPKASFTVENEAAISTPPKVDFGASK